MLQILDTTLRARASANLWTPAALGTVPALWLDADDASTITLNGSTVSQWNDKSGNGRNAVQATAANQPTYNSTFLNGKPALVFDGLAKTFQVGFPLSGNDISIFVVARRNLTSPITNSLIRWQATAYLVYPYGTVTALSTDGGVSTIDNPAAGFVSNDYGIGLYRRSRGVSKETYWNGTVSGTTSSINSALPSISTLFIGSSGGTAEFFNGYVSEICITGNAVSTDIRQKLEGYLAWKWGLEANLPAAHPFKNFPPTV